MDLDSELRQKINEGEGEEESRRQCNAYVTKKFLTGNIVYTVRG